MTAVGKYNSRQMLTQLRGRHKVPGTGQIYGTETMFAIMTWEYLGNMHAVHTLDLCIAHAAACMLICELVNTYDQPRLPQASKRSCQLHPVVPDCIVCCQQGVQSGTEQSDSMHGC